jgi:hypothetical protein
MPRQVAFLDADAVSYCLWALFPKKAPVPTVKPKTM